MRYVVLEGLPAAGKSETLSLLERFYPQHVKVLPELVKDVAIREDIDILSQREKLTEAIIAELPRRREQIEKAMAEGKTCLEESHLGVHLAYSYVLGDKGFIEAYAKISDALPKPEAYIRLDIPIEVSLTRQEARNTPEFYIDGQRLREVFSSLQRWHVEKGTNLVLIDANRKPSEFLSAVEQTLGLEYTIDDYAPEQTLEILLLLGRPASGKSEFIDFMTKTPLCQRARSYHIGIFDVLDDFPILWERCVDDDLWEELGRKRLYSRRVANNYAVTDEGMWAFLTKKLNQQVLELISKPGELEDKTFMVEFSRGSKHGYLEALSQLSPKILSRAAILYIDVSFEESWRRNVDRYDDQNRSGILSHSVPREEMEKMYASDDWFDIASKQQGTIRVDGIAVPYVTMNNEPESKDPKILGPRYATALDLLYDLWKQKS